MKHTKKILGSFLAAAVAVVSLGSMFSASAATGKYSTYRYFFDVPANMYVKTLIANVSYSPSTMLYVDREIGNLGGYVSVNHSIVVDDSVDATVHYGNSAPTGNAGCLCYATFKTTTNAPTVQIIAVRGNNKEKLDNNTVTVSTILVGDVNLDGKVNETDLALLNKSISGVVSLNNAQFRAADTDGNNEVNMNDATNLRWYINGSTDSVFE